MLLILFLAISANIPNFLCHGDVSYEDVQSLGKSCFPFDSCKTNEEFLCKCDEQCALFGDCCSDSLYRSSQRRKSAFLCQNKREGDPYGVYVKSVCPRRNVENWMRQKCEGVYFSNDIELQVPVFSSRSSIIYRNYYCALCNNDQNNLVFWDVALSCDYPVNEKEIVENLVYSDREETWGFWGFSNGKNIWVPCKISPQISPKISYYRECVSSISECHSQWRDDRVRNMCNLYESRLVSKGRIIYKNFHCALCNNVDMRDLECQQMKPDVFMHEQPGYGYSGSPKGILTINFKDIIDINLNKGNRIGKVNKCPNGQIYDEAFGRCTEVFCIGNRIPRGGKCVVA